MWDEGPFTIPTAYDHDNRSLDNSTSFAANKNYNNEIKAEYYLDGHIQSTHNRLHCLFCSIAKAHGNLILSK